MLQRTITGAIFVAALIGCILFSQYSFIGLFFIINTLGLLEFYKLIKITGHSPQLVTGIVICNLIFLCLTFQKVNFYTNWSAAFFTMTLPLVFLCFIIELFRKKEKPFGNVAYTLLGVVYVTIPFSLLSIIAFQDNSMLYNSYFYVPERILGIFFCLWANDTGAYLSGKFFGKHKLFERISPKKTWEGCVGGAILSYGVAVVVAHSFTTFSLVTWLIIASILIVVGTLGDLVESLLKRSVDVKDSGTILPGHGGILDRFDSLILAIPFIYFYYMWH